jgi:hypothetical protein
MMTETKWTWQTFKAENATTAETINALIRDGNARRVVVEHAGLKVAEFPLMVGAVGAVLAPSVAAIAAVAALYKDCTIHVERSSPSREVAAGGV